MIHLRAKENWAKRKGALPRPKGRTISKKNRPCHFIQQFPITGADEDAPECCFNVQFGHKTVLTEILEYGDHAIYLNVLARIVFRRMWTLTLVRRCLG